MEIARRRVAEAPADEQAAAALGAAVGHARLAERAINQSEAKPSIAPELDAVQAQLRAGLNEQAEIALRAYLKRQPLDPHGLVLMADIAIRSGFPVEADPILLRAIEVAPDLPGPRVALARARHMIGRVEDSLLLIDQALTLDPTNLEALSFKPALLMQLRRLDGGLEAFQDLVVAWPLHARGWMDYAFLLKTVGRYGESVAAYRTAVALDPLMGGGWWGLANLKTARFFPHDIDAMLAAVGKPGPAPGDLVSLRFALAKAFDSVGDHAQAFGQLEVANQLRKAGAPYDATVATRDSQRSRKLFTADFFAEREGWGSRSRDPIFIVGMPRSGSTLIEQILASHPDVEGTEELFAVQHVAQGLAKGHSRVDYLDVVQALSAQECRDAGERYIADTRKYRQSAEPFFTDKMPGNWAYIGLIQLMLPNARIIDARRHPLDCCFSNYSQHFQWGINFAYSLDDLGCYYRDYVAAMAHFDRVLPGRVFRVVHEQLVADPENEIRRLLAHLDLPFDERCLRFHESARAVHTPSSEQVRRPLNREGADRWKSYSEWLGPLVTALGDVIDCYPEAPPSLVHPR